MRFQKAQAYSMTLIISLSLFICEVRNICCQVGMTPYYKSFRPAFSVNGRLSAPANRGRDVFLHLWMRLCIRVGEVFSFFRESVWMSKRGRYSGPRQCGWVSKWERNFHPLVNKVGYWNGWDICIRFSICLDFEVRYFYPFVNMAGYRSCREIFILLWICFFVEVGSNVMSVSVRCHIRSRVSQVFNNFLNLNDSIGFGKRRMWTRSRENEIATSSKVAYKIRFNIGTK
jgi:hypothetical protein